MATLAYQSSTRKSSAEFWETSALNTAKRTKRKASETFDADDFENTNPGLSKKLKNISDKFALLTRPAAPTNTFSLLSDPREGPATRSHVRPWLDAAVGPRTSTAATSKRRRAPPKALPSSYTLPFSFEVALRGTVGQIDRSRSFCNQNGPIPKAPKSWFFDIHEDTAEQEVTNLLKDSTRRLDIGDKVNKHGCTEDQEKENVPPTDVVNQTPRSPTIRQCGKATETASAENLRSPLVELNAADYGLEGQCWRGGQDTFSRAAGAVSRAGSGFCRSSIYLF